MRYVIRLVGLASGEPSEDEARYLSRLAEPGGPGFLTTTADPARALGFPSADGAFEFWHSSPASGYHAVIEARPDAPHRR